MGKNCANESGDVKAAAHFNNPNGITTGEGITKTCSFFLQGEVKDGMVNITTWGEKPFAGVLKADANKVNLKIEKGQEHPGCGLVMMPEIATGLSFDLLSNVLWSELRTIANEKSYFHAEPNANKRLKSYLIRGDVIGVVANQGEWLQIDYYSADAKMSRRWIYSGDTETLQPMY